MTLVTARGALRLDGVVLYELLAGEPPFDGPTAMDILAAIVEAAPAPLPASVPLALHGIVERAMRKNLYERTQTMSALLEELTELRLELMLRAREGRATMRAVACSSLSS